MDLYYQKIGKGKPFIILHGLYGMSDNWLSIGKQLAEHFEVYLIDQRNHGNSPKSDKFGYPELVSDLEQFFEKHGIEKASILGHSMGGKTAMFFAAAHPEMISRLIVADISPRSYAAIANKAPQLEIHKKIISAMRSVDFAKANSRQDVADQMSTIIAEKRIVQFLLKNLGKGTQNALKWNLYVEGIEQNLHRVLEGFEENMELSGKSFTNFPVLFLKGELSDYIKADDEAYIRKVFPYADIVTIFDAGHWLHAEQPHTFYNALIDFIFN
jgi:pimeloyl-ACP methyl ester carboxylesterase